MVPTLQFISVSFFRLLERMWWVGGQREHCAHARRWKVNAKVGYARSYDARFPSVPAGHAQQMLLLCAFERLHLGDVVCRETFAPWKGKSVRNAICALARFQNIHYELLRSHCEYAEISDASLREGRRFMREGREERLQCTCGGEHDSVVEKRLDEVVHPGADQGEHKRSGVITVGGVFEDFTEKLCGEFAEDAGGRRHCGHGSGRCATVLIAVSLGGQSVGKGRKSELTRVRYRGRCLYSAYGTSRRTIRAAP